MAKIPQPESIGLRTPRPGRALTQVPDVRVVDGGRSGAELGNRLAQLGLDIGAADREREARHDRTAAIKAKSQFLQDKIRIESGLRDDDYSTYSSRYETDINKARERAMEMITNPELRETLGAELDLDAVQGAAKIFERSLGKEKDISRAGVTGLLEQSRNTLAEAEDDADRQRIIENVGLSVDTAVGNQYFTAQEGAALKRAFTAEYAEARMAGLTAQERVEAFKQNTWARYLPVKVRGKLEREAKDAAEKEATQAWSQNKADEIIGKYESRDERTAAAKKVKDAKRRDATLKRIDAQHARDQQIEAEKQEALDQSLTEQVVNGASTAELDQLKLAQASPQTQRALEKIHQRRLNPKVGSDAEQLVYFEDIRAGMRRDPNFLLGIPPSVLTAHLPDEYIGTVIQWRDEARAKKDPLRVNATEGQVSDIVEWMAAKRETTTDSTDHRLERAMMAEALRKRIHRFHTEQQAKPTSDDLINMRDSLMKELVFDPGKWSRNKTMHLYQLQGGEDISKLVVPDEVRQQILEAYHATHPKRMKAPGMTEVQIRQWYVEHLQGLR